MNTKIIVSSKLKNVFINSAVIFTILLGSIYILIAYSHKSKIILSISRQYAFISPNILSLHRTLSVIIGFALIFISYRLYKRMRIAWIITISLLFISILIHLTKSHIVFNIILIIEVSVIFILAFNYKEFKKSSDPVGLRNGALLGLIIVGLIILNTSLTYHLLKIKTINQYELAIVTRRTLKMILYIDPSILGKVSRTFMILIKSMIVINWIGIVSMLFFILKPLVYQPIVTAIDKEKVRTLLEKYGENPISYLATENDKKYYFGKYVEGVIAYVITSGVAVCAGDPVCSDEDMPLIITEFILYCKQNDLDICLIHTLVKHISLYTQLGFGNTKCGEEAIFNLETYNLVGGRAAKIRNAINHANTLGIKVMEYTPLKSRDKSIENQICNVSNEWLLNKKSGELSFMLGSISLENPSARRYFTAYDDKNNMLGFIVFTPFLGGKGYMADVTRRRNKAPIGVMEKIVIEAFETMKSEGVLYGSLGLAPLVNCGNDEGVIGKTLGFVYENFNNFYGFKALYHYKKKYGPSSWDARYLVYYPKLFTPKIAYSIIKAQNPRGVSNYILTQLKSIFKVNMKKNI